VSDLDFELVPILAERRILLGWMMVAFLITFLATRAITRAIRCGRGPFRNASVGGVHVHHQVYGIFLLLGTGMLEFTYQPKPPWVQVLAVLFGVGAALTLDEFALWLRLDDVYWTQQGRSSVDAVLIALVAGGAMLLGANPFDADDVNGEGVAAVTILVNLTFALITILKGRVVLGVVGVFVPVLAIIAALRLARPASWWARRWYHPGSRRWRRSHERYPPGHRNRWDAIVDLFASVPHSATPVAAPAPPATPPTAVPTAAPEK
jgi:hypothetical protein